MIQEEIYQPDEDSFLLQKYVEKYSNGKVLDVGTGSGIQAITALKYANEVVAVDINENATQLLKPLEKLHENLKVKVSDLFNDVDGKFDIIIFNPPYLPYDPDYDINNASICGGFLGCELIQKFLQNLDNHLKDTGISLIVFSSLSNQDKIIKESKRNGFKITILEYIKFPFETIFVGKIEKLLMN